VALKVCFVLFGTQPCGAGAWIFFSTTPSKCYAEKRTSEKKLSYGRHAKKEELLVGTIKENQKAAKSFLFFKHLTGLDMVEVVKDTTTTHLAREGGFTFPDLCGVALTTNITLLNPFLCCCCFSTTTGLYTSFPTHPLL